MAASPQQDDPTPSFITRWQPSGGAERSNYQLFLTELCDLLQVDRPDPASSENDQNAYVFERSVAMDNRDGTTSTGYIDLYKRSAFICETKQGVEKQQDAGLLSGKAQTYARGLPASEGRPPAAMVGVDARYRTGEQMPGFWLRGRDY